MVVKITFREALNVAIIQVDLEDNRFILFLLVQSVVNRDFNLSFVPRAAGAEIHGLLSLFSAPIFRDSL